MRVRRVGRPIGVSTMTEQEKADRIGQAMARNLNHNVLKEDAEQKAEQEKRPSSRSSPPSKPSAKPLLVLSTLPL